MKRFLSTLFLSFLGILVYGQRHTDTVFFDSGSHDFRIEGLEKLKGLPLKKIRLEGRTDAKGDIDYNMALSERRVNAVRDVLIKEGHKEITLDYYGESKPIGEGISKKGEQTNRCVVIHYELDEKLLPFPEPEPAKYAFINNEGTTITLDNGVKINILAHTFDAPPSATIDFKVTSYMTKTDFILADLHSMAGDSLLESAGMFQLEATVNEKSVKIREGKNIEVQVPNKTRQTDFELFQGEEQAHHAGKKDINWVHSPNSAPFIQSNGSDGAVNQGFFTVDGIGQRFEINAVIERQGLIIGDRWAYRPHKSKWFKIDRDELSEAMNPQKKAIAFKVSLTLKKGAVDSIVFENITGTLVKRSEKKLIRLLQRADWRKRKQAVRLTFNFECEGSKVKEDTIDINKASLDMITMNVTSMGWINCDRFYNVIKRKPPIYVSADARTSVRLVFSKFDGIMKGRYQSKKGFLFDGIPAKEPFTILAYKNTASGVLAAQQAHDSDEALEFKLMTREEFVDLLDNL